MSGFCQASRGRAPSCYGTLLGVLRITRRNDAFYLIGIGKEISFMMQTSPSAQNASTAQNTGTAAGPASASQELADQSLPSTPRTGFFSKMSGVAAMTLAMAGAEVPSAQAQEQPPQAPTPIVAPAIPGVPVGGVRVVAPPPPEVVADRTKSNVTVLKGREFGVDDYGTAILAKDCAVRGIGETKVGKPSRGEAMRAIAEGVEHIKLMNGGAIPAGYEVNLVIQSKTGAVIRPLNPDSVPAIANISTHAMGAANRDPKNNAAITAFTKEVSMRLFRSGADTIDISFIGRDFRSSAEVTVELVKR